MAESKSRILSVGTPVFVREIGIPSAAAIRSRIAITDRGMGRILNWSLVIIFPVCSESILTDPVRFPVGSMTTASSVLAFSVLSVSGTVHCT